MATMEKTNLFTAAGIAMVLLALGGCAMIGNRFEQQLPREQITPSQSFTKLPTAPDVLTITTWNVGYGGMGEESDFVFDGGQQRRPPKPGYVDKNISGIAKTVAAFDADILLFQEVAKPSWTNYGRDLVDVLDRGTSAYQGVLNADILTRGIPRPLRVEIGNSTYMRHRPSSFELIALPLEPYFEFGLFRKNYRIHVVQLEGAVNWTIANIHLSAFDPEDVDIRGRQVGAVFKFAEAEYEAGRHVVVGGDWNLILSDAAFPHRTPDKHSFWVRDFPLDDLPLGWGLAAADNIPTVRLAHAPYAEGVNRTIAIDGFVFSPNVSLRAIEAHSLGFKWSDHNPVTGTFKAH